MKRTKTNKQIFTSNLMYLFWVGFDIRPVNQKDISQDVTRFDEEVQIAQKSVLA